jgi:hypothetical protein
VEWRPGQKFELNGELVVGNPSTPYIRVHGKISEQNNTFRGALSGYLYTTPLPEAIVRTAEFLLDMNIPDDFTAGAYIEISDDGNDVNDFLLVGADFSAWQNIHLAGYEDLEQYLPLFSLMAASPSTRYQLPVGLDASFFDMNWEQGDADLNLIGPDGTVYTPANHEGYPNVEYLKYPTEKLARFVVRNPAGGIWQLVVPETEGIGSYTFSAQKSSTAPTITLLTPNSDTTSGTVNITWVDVDSDSDAMISLYYDTDRSGADGTLITTGISENDVCNNYPWNTAGLPTGDYYVYAVIRDGVNMPAISYATGLVSVVDPDAPAQITSVNAPFESGSSVKISWEASSATDLDHYLIRITAHAAGEGYESTVATTDAEWFLDGLTTGGSYRVAIAAVDHDGHIGSNSDAIVLVPGGQATVPPATGEWQVFATPGTSYQAQVPGNTGDSYQLISGPVDATLSPTTGLFEWNVPLRANNE